MKIRINDNNTIEADSPDGLRVMLRRQYALYQKLKIFGENIPLSVMFAATAFVLGETYRSVSKKYSIELTEYIIQEHALEIMKFIDEDKWYRSEKAGHDVFYDESIMLSIGEDVFHFIENNILSSQEEKELLFA